MKNKFLIFIVFIPIFFFTSCETTELGSYEELGDKYFLKIDNILDEAVTFNEFFRNSKKLIKYSSSVIKNYEKALTQNPKDINLIKKLALAYYCQGYIKSFLEIQSTTDYEKALSYYDEIIEANVTPEADLKKMGLSQKNGQP